MKPYKRKQYWNEPTLTPWERAYLPEILRGLVITSGVFLRNMQRWITGKKGALTIYYPEETRADYAPLNPATGTPYFTIKAIAWGSSFQANDTITFATQPAAIPIWYRRQVPAGTFSLANDYTSLAIHGESA